MDVVVSIETIEHLEARAPKAAALRPGGLCFVLRDRFAAFQAVPAPTSRHSCRPI